MKNYFSVYACCIPVKGYKRSLICDTQRNNFDFIPNSLADILLNEITKFSIHEIKTKYIGHEEVIDEYFNFLLIKEYGFFTDEPSSFPKTLFNNLSPNAITNAIIDFDKFSKHDLDKIFNQLSSLFCNAIELRFFDTITIDTINNILHKADNSTIRSIQIILPYTDDFNLKVIEALILNFPRITSLIFHSYSDESIFRQVYDINIFYTKENISSENCCGQVSPDYFVCSLPMISESQKHNSCLNKKVSIDKHGNIKNCPSCKVSFGNHHSDSIEGIIKLSNFQEVWGINKDEIEICKDCEFRYICQDCRAYTMDEKNKYSKPIKCKYNPYEATWA